MKIVDAKLASNEKTYMKCCDSSMTSVTKSARGTSNIIDDNVMQLKPYCVCGGGCPRCQKKLTIQPKLIINKDSDKYEEEEGKVAEEVMSLAGRVNMGISDYPQKIQRKCVHCISGKRIRLECEGEEESIQRKYITLNNNPVIQRQDEEIEEEEEKLIQTKTTMNMAPEMTPADEARIKTLRNGGVPLSKYMRDYFEPRFGHDFSQVRIHTDAAAADAARAVSALAYTDGSHVVFGKGRFAAETEAGKRLLAHELTHVVQQSSQTNGSPCDRRSEESVGTDCDFGESIARRTANTLTKRHDLLPSGEVLFRSPDKSVWGGYKISGTNEFIVKVRDDLNRINSTKMGAALLAEISANRSPWYRSLITIVSGTSCGFVPNVGIIYAASGCGVKDRCSGASEDWKDVPNYVYLFHEVVHTYLYYIQDKGEHPERECMTTGLGAYFSSIPYNENRFRCELGLPVRPCYDNDCPGMAAPSCDAAQQTAISVESGE